MPVQREAVGGGRSGGLLDRVWRRARSGTPGGPGKCGRRRDGTGGPGGRQQERPLDWRELQEHLEPVLRHWWDVAILVNLDEEEGRQTAELLPVINAQAGRDRQLKPQVLYVRLRALAQDGYLSHQDVSRTPVTKVYRLLPPGKTLIEDLASFGFLLRTRGSRARVLRSSHGGTGGTPPAQTRPGSGQEDG